MRMKNAAACRYLTSVWGYQGRYNLTSVWVVKDAAKTCAARVTTIFSKSGRLYLRSVSIIALVEGRIFCFSEGGPKPTGVM